MLTRLHKRLGLSRLKIAVLVPLAACICAMVLGIVYTIEQRHEKEDVKRIDELTESARSIFRISVQKDTQMMASTIKAIMEIEELKHSFLARNRDALYQASRPLFESLRRDFDITHFYFTGTDRVNFLRVHQRPRHGDTIIRKSTLIAARDGKQAHGLELGPLGTFTLRVVVPWQTDEGVIGYIELGKEIEGIIADVGTLANTGIYAFVHKQYLDRKHWEEGMRMLGRDPHWERLKDVVLTSESGGEMSSHLIDMVNSGALHEGGWELDQEWNGRYVQATSFPVNNIEGQQRALLVLVDDITTAHIEDKHLTQLTIIISLLTGFGLMVFFWFILDRVEKNLEQKEEQLQQNLLYQQIIASILHVSLQPVAFHEILQQALDKVLGSHGFDHECRGCIFLVDESGDQLVMVAQSQLAEPLMQSCARVPFGHCLCGQAAQTGATVYKGHIDECHEIRYEGMTPHGHYCTPIKNGETVIGVLNIYVSDGHQFSEIEKHFLATVADTLSGIIQREQAEDELERQKILFEAVFRDVPDAMALTNTHREIVDTNPAMTRIFGYESDELKGRPTSILYENEADYVRQGEIRFNLGAEKRLEPYVMNYRQKNGGVFPGETVSTAIKDSHGNTLGFIGVIRDISDRLKAEQALRNANDELELRVAERTRELTQEIAEHEQTEARLSESREQARALLESAGEGIYGVNQAGISTFINPAAARMLGYRTEDLIDVAMHNCVHHSYADGSHYPLDKCLMNRTLIDGSSHHMEHDVLWREDGTSFPVEYTSTPIMRNGEVAGAVVTFRDISERLESENVLRIAKEQAEAANLAKSRFLATMSHELRTPLNAIIGYSELLSEEARESGQQAIVPDLDRIRTSGKHLLGLINDILDLSKIEAGRMELKVEPFGVADTVYEVTAAVQSLVEKNGNHIEVDYGKAAGDMVADHTKVRQILFNLLSNAAKFTNNGRIRLELENAKSDAREWIVFRVIDTGAGIRGEHLDEVFESFSQADSASNRQYEGTGLGLAITKRLCVMMGGEIEVESEPGIGSVFTVRLPKNQGHGPH